MKKITKNLTIHRNTIRALTDRDLGGAIGGSVGPTHSDACNK